MMVYLVQHPRSLSVFQNSLSDYIHQAFVLGSGASPLVLQKNKQKAMKMFMYRMIIKILKEKYCLKFPCLDWILYQCVMF